MIKATASKRGDTITFSFHGVHVRLSVKKRSDWGVLGHGMVEAVFREPNSLSLLHWLYGRNPEMVTAYLLWALSNGHRPEDKRLQTSINRQLKIGNNPKERDSYTFQLTAAFLYEFLAYLKPIWKGPVPLYLERFREALHGGGFKAIASPWGARAVRECMKQMDLMRVKRVSSASFARKYCYPKREVFSIWLNVLHREIEEAKGGKGSRRLGEAGKRKEAWQELKKGSPVAVFFALFCLAWKYPADAEAVATFDSDAEDMNARIRAFLKNKVEG